MPFIEELKVGIVGYGTLGSSICLGLVNAGFAPEQIYVTSLEEPTNLPSGVLYSSSLNNLVDNVDMIILAIPTSAVNDCLACFQLRPDQLFVSAVAGIQTEILEDILRSPLCTTPRVSRIVTSVSVRIGKGSTLIFPGHFSHPVDESLVSDVFGLMSNVEKAETETELDVFIALCETGPFFVRRVLEGLVQGCVAEGMDKERAEKMSLSMMLGASSFFAEKEFDQSTFAPRKESSTEAGLKILNENGWAKTLSLGLRKATAHLRQDVNEDQSDLGVTESVVGDSDAEENEDFIPCVPAWRQRAHEQGRIIVLKVGSAMLTEPSEYRLALSRMCNIVELVIALRRKGYFVILVSSGAVAAGCIKMGKKRPTTVEGKQAMAAVGQNHLMRMWEDLFSSCNQPVAQFLLSRYDLSIRKRYINATNTLDSLLSMGVVPIVNENDAMTSRSMRFHDNDRLSALISSMLKANWLFLLTDVDGVYTDNPATNPNAMRIPFVDDPSALRSQVKLNSKSKSAVGTGGMDAKLIAASIAAHADVITCILAGNDPTRVLQVLETGIESREIGTIIGPSSMELFTPTQSWLAGTMPEGEVKVRSSEMPECLKDKRTDLSNPVAIDVTVFPQAVVAVEGNFGPDSVVNVVDATTAEVFGKARSRYSSTDLLQMSLLADTHDEEKSIFQHDSFLVQPPNMVEKAVVVED
eukprot:GCRY01000502.1.p1 GENE.GCRY01000502.1~~GCRY01000502.1.p1  ORF type:complete len:695 (+),score=198.60 GCRY01000502.1:147-2231(+)